MRAVSAMVGAFDLMSPLCGHEHLLVGMALDPGWVHEMADLYADVTLRLLEKLFGREGKPDGLWVWDDLGFANGPGLHVILHCDGFVEALLPSLIGGMGVRVLETNELSAVDAELERRLPPAMKGAPHP
jgi:uroporphyrinogen decarboxylase